MALGEHADLARGGSWLTARLLPAVVPSLRGGSPHLLYVSSHQTHELERTLKGGLLAQLDVGLHVLSTGLGAHLELEDAVGDSLGQFLRKDKDQEGLRALEAEIARTLSSSMLWNTWKFSS